MVFVQVMIATLFRLFEMRDQSSDQNPGANSINASGLLSKPINTSHPCFGCGLMFAKYSDYEQHQSIFHSKADNSITDRSNERTFYACNVCGDIFDAKFRKGFARHRLEHDLAILFQALYDQEERDSLAKRLTTKQESAIKSPVVAESSAASTSENKPIGRKVAKFLENERVKKRNAEILEEQKEREAAQKKIEEEERKRKQAASVETPPKRSKLSRTTKLPNDSPPIKQKDGEILAADNGSETKCESPEVEIQNTGTKLKIKFNKLYRRKLGECDKKMIEDSKMVDEPIAANESLSTKSTPLQTTANVSLASSPQESAETTTAPPPATAAATTALSRECPHCHECLKSPWLLVGHMITQHGDKLTFLERRILPVNADKSGELCESFETFAPNSRCTYCGDDATVFESNDEEQMRCEVFTHVLLYHRDRLLEYRADISECDLRFEVVSQINDEPPKKFKIRVKTKLKSKSG